MKRLMVGLIIISVVFWMAGASRADDRIGPGKFFNMQEILDETTLNIVKHKDEVVSSTARPGKKVRRIELTFTSQVWHESTWTHPARIYIPENYQGGGQVGIIGTHIGLFQDPAASTRPIPGTQTGVEAEFVEGTALDLGLPIMIFAAPAENSSGLHESDLMGYAMKKLFQTGDLTWFGYYPIAMSYLRAITLLHAIPEIKAERAVLLGCSKRGYAVCITTGVDPERVAGVMSTCYFGGNNLYWIAMKFAQFGPYLSGPAEKRAGPGYQPATALLDMFNNPIGYQLLLYFDPYNWRSKIKSAYLVALGTNDEFYALGTPNVMMKRLKGDKAFLAVDNTPHTWQSQKHLAAWRMWLAHTFLKRPVPQIEVKAEVTEEKLSVRATVAAGGNIQGVNLLYARNKTTDWREAVWSTIPMTRTADAYTADLDLAAGQKTAYYVEVEDTGPGGPGYVSSLVEIID